MKITEEGNDCPSELVPKLLEIAAKHDVVHLLALGLKRNKLIHKENIDINKYIHCAVYRYEQLRYEYDNLCSALKKGTHSNSSLSDSKTLSRSKDADKLQYRYTCI